MTRFTESLVEDAALENQKRPQHPGGFVRKG